MIPPAEDAKTLQVQRSQGFVPNIEPFRGTNKVPDSSSLTIYEGSNGKVYDFVGVSPGLEGQNGKLEARFRLSTDTEKTTLQVYPPENLVTTMPVLLELKAGGSGLSFLKKVFDHNMSQIGPNINILGQLDSSSIKKKDEVDGYNHIPKLPGMLVNIFNSLPTTNDKKAFLETVQKLDPALRDVWTKFYGKFEGYNPKAQEMPEEYKAMLGKYAELAGLTGEVQPASVAAPVVSDAANTLSALANERPKRAPSLVSRKLPEGDPNKNKIGATIDSVVADPASYDGKSRDTLVSAFAQANGIGLLPDELADVFIRDLVYKNNLRLDDSNLRTHSAVVKVNPFSSKSSIDKPQFYGGFNLGNSVNGLNTTTVAFPILAEEQKTGVLAKYVILKPRRTTDGMVLDTQKIIITKDGINCDSLRELKAPFKNGQLAPGKFEWVTEQGVVQTAAIGGTLIDDQGKANIGISYAEDSAENQSNAEESRKIGVILSKPRF